MVYAKNIFLGLGEQVWLPGIGIWKTKELLNQLETEKKIWCLPFKVYFRSLEAPLMTLQRRASNRLGLDHWRGAIDFMFEHAFLSTQQYWFQ